MAQPSPAAGIRIFSIRGIPIYLHVSWFVIFALITLSLAKQFTSQHPAWSQTQHYALGIITSVLFFASVVFHELSHSFVALRYRIPVKSITLFVFGGLAGIGREPDNAKQEFNIAIAQFIPLGEAVFDELRDLSHRKRLGQICTATLSQGVRSCYRQGQHLF